MTQGEFKAWFEGFTEAMSGAPTKAQWARITKRVAEIDGTAITRTVYIDRYWPHYSGGYYPYQHFGYNQMYSGLRQMGGQTNAAGQYSPHNANAGAQNTALYSDLQNAQSSNSAFDSQAAMFALGKNDFKQ